jgi:hypothetical protein
MRALSLWQPHAQAIALGIKPYETRHWPTDYRGPLVIHAAKKVFRYADDPNYYLQVRTRMNAANFDLQYLDYGRALCVVAVVDCIPTEKLYLEEPWGFWGDFTAGRYAFKLENVRKITPPLFVAGRQKFFNIELPEGSY